MAIYLQIADVKGSATETNHKDWIDVVAIEWDIVRTSSTKTGAGANRDMGSAQVGRIMIRKVMDASTQGILKNAFTADGKKVVIHLTRTGDNLTYAEYTLENAIVGEYKLVTIVDENDQSKQTLFEQVYFDFTKFEYKFTPSDLVGKGAGPLSMNFDIGLNKLG